MTHQHIRRTGAALALAALCVVFATDPATAARPQDRHACGVEQPARRASRVSPQTCCALTLRFVDADDGSPIAVRAGVFASRTTPLPPIDPEAALFQDIEAESYFWADGEETIAVPAGQVHVYAGRGFEYEPVTTSTRIDSDTTITIPLARVYDMNALGWYAVDTHVHISHVGTIYGVTPEQLVTVMEAEGLNFVNSLEEEPYFTGDLHPAGTPERLLYFSKEQRNAHLSHLTIIGLREWIPDQGCAVQNAPCGATLDGSIHTQVHAQGDGALVIATHPFPTYDLFDYSPWPGGGAWRGMAMDLAGGTVDAMDILCYSHDAPPSGVEPYFHALNAGVAVPPSAGSDASVGSGASYPPGGYRLYVSPGAGGFDLDGIVDAIRGGRTFVTNYPLFTRFTLDGAAPGDTIRHRGERLKGRVEVSCLVPFERVELIADGRVIDVLAPEEGSDGRSLARTFTIDPTQVHWLVARVTGASSSWHLIDAGGLFAQTAPVFFALSRGDGGEPGGFGFVNPDPRRVGVQYILDLARDVDFAYTLGVFPDGSRAAFDSASAAAITYFEGAYPDPPGPFSLTSHLELSWNQQFPTTTSMTPTFTWEPSVDPDPGDSVTYEFVIDTSPQLNAATVLTALTDTFYTIPAEDPLQDGELYFYRVAAIDRGGRRRLVDQGIWAIRVDAAPISAGPTSPSAWRIDAVFPNPFNPVLHVRYNVPPGGGRHVVAVFDVAGKRVRTLFDGVRADGGAFLRWDGRDETGRRLPSGVYLLRVEPSGSTPLTRKLVLLK